MRFKAKILFLIALAAVFSGCEKNSAKRYNPEKEIVMLYYAAAYNNLSSNIKGNLNVLKSANMPFYGSKHRILTFTHFSKTDSDYTTKTESHLVMLSKDFGKLRCDTLYTISHRIGESPNNIPFRMHSYHIFTKVFRRTTILIAIITNK